MSTKLRESTLVVLLLAAAACGGGGADPDADVPDGSSGDGDVVPDVAEEDAASDDASDGEDDAPPPVADCDDPRFAAYVAALDDDMVRSRVTGVAVAVVEGSHLTFACARGLTRPDAEGSPVLPSTLFRIGSMTKVLTAGAVLQLVDEGRVTLGARVTDFVADFHYDREPAWASSFSIEQLLTHTAGPFGDFAMAAPPEEQSDPALSVFFTVGRYPATGYLMSTPGTLWNFSSTGYALLGLVAETVRGEPYRTVVRDRVLGPLGMDRTVFLPSEVLADGDFAWGVTTPSHWVDADGITTSPVAPDAYDNGWARPTAYAWSSVLDLSRLLLFLAHGDARVLSDELRAAMVASRRATHKLVTTAGEELTWSGYGPLIDSVVNLDDGWRRMTSYLVNGYMPGYVARMRWFPDLGFGFVHLMNADAGDFKPSFHVLFDLLAELPPVTAPGLVADPARLPLYAGTYEDPFLLGEIRVSYSSGAGLTVALPQLDAAGISYSPYLVPAEPDHFNVIIDWHALGLDNWNDVTFLPDGTGVYRWLYNPVFVATRPPAG